MHANGGGLLSDKMNRAQKSSVLPAGLWNYGKEDKQKCRNWENHEDMGDVRSL
jgi:hypothetical protein